MNEFKAKNHYVPKFYLKQWGACSNEVWVYKTLVSHKNENVWKKRSTGAIAHLRDIYTQIISGVETDEFERWIDSHYEFPAKVAIEKATSDRRLTRDDWAALISFLACQDVRTPARLLEHIKRGDSELKKSLQDSIEKVKYEIENNLVIEDDFSESSNE